MGTADARRPHTGSACTQCTFHTLLLESYLQGDITLDNMGQQAREFSKLLVTGGRELGVYTQSTELTPPEKAQKYMAAWLPIQADLSTKYNNYVNSAGAKI